MSFRRGLVVLATVFFAGSGCSSTTPTSPTQTPVPTPAAGTTAITGKVWLHSPQGVSPFAGAKVFGWLDRGNGGQTTGAIPTMADGTYSIPVPAGIVRVRVAAMTSSVYQPCAVTLPASAGVGRDVHVFSDTLQLGANLPASLTSGGPLMSGVVYEMIAGSRRPLANAGLELDGLGGDGLVIATTVTDSEGRYVFCSVPFEPNLFLYAYKDGYQLFGAGSLGATLDIEMKAK